MEAKEGKSSEIIEAETHTIIQSSNEVKDVKKGFLMYDEELKHLLMFDPINVSWSQPQRDISEEMTRLTALTLDEYLYVLMWNKSAHRLKYSDEKATWESLEDMIDEHGVCPPAVTTSGCIYVAGGSHVRQIESAEVYDPSLKKWQMLAKKELSTRDSALATAKGFIYSIGGISTRRYLQEVERFDLSSKSWTFVAPMKQARRAPAATEFNGKVFVLGGFADEYAGKLSSVECYDPMINTWMMVEEMAKPRAEFSACVANGRIYALGGDRGDDSVERYETDKTEKKDKKDHLFTPVKIERRRGDSMERKGADKVEEKYEKDRVIIPLKMNIRWSAKIILPSVKTD